MFLLRRLSDEPRFAGSRFAPAGCAIYDIAGTYTWTWPDGVDRAVVTCKGSGGGGEAGTAARGGDAGGGPAFAERLVLKTDATAAVQVPAKGIGGITSGQDGTDGGDSSFIQSSSVVEYCAAVGGKGGGAALGLGGLASASYGTIKKNGGNGGLHDQRGGGGGGAAGCDSADGDPGDAGDASGSPALGGEGGGVCPGGAPSTGGGKGGDEDVAGQNANDGGGGGGGRGQPGGDGSPGEVIICWEDPIPTGYCVDANCKKWWGFGQGCNYYGYAGKRCFYYGYYPYVPYLFPGLPISCCDDDVAANPLTLTITNHGLSGCSTLASQTVPMYARPDGKYYGWIAAFSGYLVFDPATGFGSDTCGQLYCTWGNWTIGTYLQPISCSPLYLIAGVFASTPGICIACAGTGKTHTFEITE